MLLQVTFKIKDAWTEIFVQFLLVNTRQEAELQQARLTIYRTRHIWDTRIVTLRKFDVMFRYFFLQILYNFDFRLDFIFRFYFYFVMGL